MIRSIPTRSGLTLIEVVAATALMGTLLTATLVANSRHVRQMKLAQEKRKATRMLDRFLATWSISDFKKEAIPKAVQRSGLAVTGQLGVHGLATEDPGTQPPYRVHIRRHGDSDLGGTSRFRLTVQRSVAGDRIRSLTWAEVLAEP